MKKITAPLTDKAIAQLKAGDEVLLSGSIYTARDQAHKRMVKNPPFNLKGQVIYYCGPAKTPKGKVIGACGPTTSSRMDEFTPVLLKKGLKGMIGKGGRSEEVRRAIKKYKGIYFLALAGCGALISKYICKSTPVAYPELGPEAVLKLEVEGLPLIVGIDTKGRCVYAKK